MTAPPLSKATPAGRRYVWPPEPAPAAMEVPSVTTVLDVLGKDGLVGWASKVVAEAAVGHMDFWLGMGTDDAVRWLKGRPGSERDDAAALGTAVHKAVESWVGDGVEPDGDHPTRAMFDQFLLWAQAHDVTRDSFGALEQTVFGDGYAGTFDAIVRVGGRTLMLDYKTGKCPRDWTRKGGYGPCKGAYDETALQLAAYRYGRFVGHVDGTQTPVPATDAAAVLHLRPDHYTYVEVDADRSAHAVFLAALMVWRFRQQTWVRPPSFAVAP